MRPPDRRPNFPPTLHFQPKSNFFAPAVPPLGISNIVLPGGKTEPYYYCLGADSTIPFVSLQGGGASQKVITWGEMIEVLPGQTVRVQNQSYMQGDIQINSGHDFAAKPDRISLTVPITITQIGDVANNQDSWKPVFPADTRLCRRAYLKVQLYTDFIPIAITITGKPQKHSFPAVDLFTGLQTYTELFNILPFTNAGEIPLGYGSDNASVLSPMALTDQVTFEFVAAHTAGKQFLNTLIMYCLEY